MTGTMITNNVTISKILVENFIVRTSICKPIIMLYNKAAFTLFHNHGSTAHTNHQHAVLFAQHFIVDIHAHYSVGTHLLGAR